MGKSAGKKQRNVSLLRVAHPRGAMCVRRKSLPRVWRFGERKRCLTLTNLLIPDLQEELSLPSLSQLGLMSATEHRDQWLCWFACWFASSGCRDTGLFFSWLLTVFWSRPSGKLIWKEWCLLSRIFSWTVWNLILLWKESPCLTRGVSDLLSFIMPEQVMWDRNCSPVFTPPSKQITDYRLRPHLHTFMHLFWWNRSVWL